MKKNTKALQRNITKVHHRNSTNDTPRKNELSLFTILVSGDSGVIQPEAFIIYGESCLHSSVSNMRNDFGLDILGEPERYQHRHGTHTYFHRYRFASRSAGLDGLKVLNQLRKRRYRCP